MGSAARAAGGGAGGAAARLQAGRFSFNVKGGRCEACEGAGIVQIEMHFLPDVYVQCEVCKGKRYNRETLEIHYKGNNVAEILEMTVDEALDFFSAVPSIKNKLQTLHDVGMGYIHLGQPATTLSGGEAQRVKLATELSKRATGKTFYILDEPTTGLHFDDVARLLDVLARPGRDRQHGGRDRAQPGRHQERRLGDRPGPGGRRRGRRAGGQRDAGAGREGPGVVHRALPAARPGREGIPAGSTEPRPRRRPRLSTVRRASRRIRPYAIALTEEPMPAVLAVIGLLIVLIGVLGDSNLPLIFVGIAFVVGGGLLQLRIARRA